MPGVYLLDHAFYSSSVDQRVVRLGWRCRLWPAGGVAAQLTSPKTKAPVLAGVDLARRLALADVPERHPLDRPAEMFRYLTQRYGIRDQEIRRHVMAGVKKSVR